jgi:GNAT superfamily N-acetyltransferase
MARDLYAEYMQEREGVSFLFKEDKGFVQYRINGEECYIQVIYVVPEQRRTGLAAQMADEVEAIAKEHGCTFLTGSCDPTAKGSTESATAMIRTGFKLHSARENFIVFIRSIK